MGQSLRGWPSIKLISGQLTCMIIDEIMIQFITIQTFVVRDYYYEIDSLPKVNRIVMNAFKPMQIIDS